jgi:thiol-disulfide isomerase/thioredoxin
MAPSRPGAVRRTRRVAASALAAAAVLLGACGTDSPAFITTSDPDSSTAAAATTGTRPAAPAFRATLFDGSVFDLTEHLSRDGRPVLLNLWASWCPPCRDEMPDLDAAARRHPGVLFLGIAVEDDPAAAAAAAAEIGVGYSLGFDGDGTVAGAFPSPGLPATFLIDDDGTLIGAVYGRLDPERVEELVATYFAG